MNLFFFSIWNLIFVGYTGSKNRVWNRQKIKFKNKFREIQTSENYVYIDKRIVDNTYYEQMQVQVLLQWITSCLKLSVPKATEQFLPNMLLFISFFTVLSTDNQLFISCLWQPYDASPRTVKVDAIYEVLSTHMFVFLSLGTLVMKLGMPIPWRFSFFGIWGIKDWHFFQSSRSWESGPYSSGSSRNFRWIRSIKIKYP